VYLYRHNTEHDQHNTAEANCEMQRLAPGRG
jgi:hypothetical protein